MKPTYPDAARELLSKCRSYRRKDLPLPALKQYVWDMSVAIRNPEEREIYEFLQGAEGDLDIMEFTVDDDKLFSATLPLVMAIEDSLIAYLSPQEDV